MNQVETLREIALSRAMDHQMNEIVRAAGRLAALLRGGTMRENQLRNVLDVSLHTESLELIGNYIRYQIGRGAEWQRKNFGEELITALGDGGVVHGAAQKAVEQALHDLERARQEGKLGDAPLPSREELMKEAHIRLARLFLGYLNRWFLYADRRRAWDKIKPMIKEAAA